MSRLGSMTMGIAVLLAGATGAISQPLAGTGGFTIGNMPDLHQIVPGPDDVQSLRDDMTARVRKELKAPELFPGAQAGRGNALMALVAGNRNDVMASQIGSEQHAILIANGNDNSIAMIQSGIGNSVAAEQTGNRNSLVIVQKQ